LSAAVPFNLHRFQWSKPTVATGSNVGFKQKSKTQDHKSNLKKSVKLIKNTGSDVWY
jgi:hypothetical protein